MDEIAQAPLTRQPAGHGIQVISRATSILRALQNEPNGLSLSQIAARVSLPRSTVQRIVGALATEGLVMAATSSGRLRLGAEILALAASSKLDTVEMAHPEIKALSEATGETVDLAVLRKDHLVFVDQVVGCQRLRAVSAVGEIFPLHSTANGKACLALMSDAEARRVLPRSLPPIADGTVRSFEEVMKEIEEVRRTRLAFDEEEHTKGISAVGAAFRDRVGLIYAVSVPAPTARFNTERERLKSLLLATLDRLVEHVGSQAPDADDR
jgi:DNA-binding IclR family transcriptional regulator